MDEFEHIRAEIDQAIADMKPKKPLPWWKRRIMKMIFQFIERQIDKAQWGWTTSLPAMLGGLAALFVEIGKMFDGKPETTPDDAIIGVAIGLIVSGWNSKPSDKHGVPPKTLAAEIAKAEDALNTGSAPK